MFYNVLCPTFHFECSWIHACCTYITGSFFISFWVGLHVIRRTIKNIPPFICKTESCQLRPSLLYHIHPKHTEREIKRRDPLYGTNNTHKHTEEHNTSMTTLTGPAKLHMSLSYMEIQQKSGLPYPSGSNPTASPAAHIHVTEHSYIKAYICVCACVCSYL